MKQTIKGKLVAVQNGVYVNYVFQNLDEQETSELRYITITKCPNWQYIEDLNIGDTGFVVFEFANAGDSYLDISNGETKQYRYTANYFMNFIKNNEKDNIKEFKF